MFSLQDIKEYWCIVAVNDDADHVTIMRTSEDVNTDDSISIVSGDTVGDTQIDQEWFDSWVGDESTLTGVYKLVLEPVYEASDDDESESEASSEPDEKLLDYLKVTEVVTLYVLG